MTKIYNKANVKELRRKLRKEMTEAEKILWEKLRKRQIKNKRFLRQFSVNRYILDFYCPELKLAIEIDGEYHNKYDEKKYDSFRQKEVENYGIQLLRFSNKEVTANIEQVISTIEIVIESN